MIDYFMEGTLLKWTNYYNGWQPRYFVLSETGVLSYYKSKELIHEGCKGSCLVLACEVKAHPNDCLRFDLIIPGEQFFCLKTKSQSERQRWLVALGSCKSQGTKSIKNIIPKENTDAYASNVVSRLSAIDSELKLKVQELRLYETVLMQRVHAVKSIVNNTPTPDVQKLDETTSMLNATCDAFIHTLDECSQLATGNSTQPLFLSPTSSNNLEILSKQIIYRTFFSELEHRFSTLISLSFQEIPSEYFLLTCEEYLAFIDKLNSTTFLSYQSDINILTKKYHSNTNQFATLNSMIEDEIITQKYSATNALICLQRNLDFVRCFLYEFSRGDKTIEESLNKAYGQTLKQFHNWKIRESFSIAFKSVLSNEEVFLLLSIDRNDTQEVLFERQILSEMNEHSHNMKIVLSKINEFFIENKLQLNDI